MVDRRSGADADVHAVRAGRLLPQRVVDRRRARATTSNCVPHDRGHQPEPDVRVEPRRHPAGDPLDLDRLGRAGHREEGPDRQGLDRPHRHPADDARAARPEGRLRLGRPRGDRVPQGRRGPEVPRSEARRRGARRDMEADQRVVRAVLDGHAVRVDRRAGQQHARATRPTRTPRARSRRSAPSATRSRARSGWRSGTPSSTTRRSTTKQAKAWIKQGQDYLDQARGAVRRSSVVRPANAKELDEDQPHRGHLRGEPQLRQPLRRLGGRERPRERRRGAHDAGQPGRERLRLPEAGRREPDVACRSPTTCTDSTAGNAERPVPEPLHERAVQDRRLHPADGDDVSRRRSCSARRTASSDPDGLPGGCTRDLVHRFYQEPYQLDGGTQDRYVTGSDAIGLSMGYYDTTTLPIYQYLHAKGHPDYAIVDDFFQGAFGGSFLNHQWLIAAATPTWLGALNDGRPTTCTRCSTRTGCRTTTRCTVRRWART